MSNVSQLMETYMNVYERTYMNVYERTYTRTMDYSQQCETRPIGIAN